MKRADGLDFICRVAMITGACRGIMQFNVDGAWHVTQAAWSHMIAKGYSIPANSDRSGTLVSRAIASVEPEFAQILAAAKAARASKPGARS
jgi:NAD(P)-dependent dehydrogenase (short-subunit alcohol dehydrogenase family)